MINEFIPKIRDLAAGMPKTKIMEVCGGHTNTIMRYGLRDILPGNIRLVAGPGCPVCVTSQRDIDSIIHLAQSGVKVCTYGDMLHVPGTEASLDDARSKGADIKMAVSAQDALRYRDHVFFAVGFETTTPMTAFLLEKGIKVYSTHKVMPPPMRHIATTQSDLKGFIDPGHVSTVTGTALWESLNIPQVICGFRPDQMLRGIYRLLKLIKEDDRTVINDYPEVVRPEGNTRARDIIRKNLRPVDSEWRGIGCIPQSGLDPRDDHLNAKIIYEDILSEVKSEEPEGCRCGDIIKGLIEPDGCPLFGTSCSPDSPKGACMVSSTEGACAIYYRYRK